MIKSLEKLCLPFVLAANGYPNRQTGRMCERLHSLLGTPSGKTASRRSAIAIFSAAPIRPRRPDAELRLFFPRRCFCRFSSARIKYGSVVAALEKTLSFRSNSAIRF